MKYEPDFWRDNFYEIKIRNTNFGKLYIDLILKKLCRENYISLGKWGKMYGDRYGVINTGFSLENVKMIAGERQKKFYDDLYNMTDTDWSLLNKIDTHYSAASIIIDYVMEKYKIDLIFSTGVDNETMKNNRLSWLLFEKYLTMESKNILTPYGEDIEIFNDVMGYLAWSYFNGEISEYESINNFKKILGYKNFKKNKMGQFEDIYDGQDFQADDDSIQAKSFTTIIKNNDSISFPNVKSKPYPKVDMFSFWNEKDRSWFVFKNQNVNKNGNFTFKVESLIYPSTEDYIKNYSNI